jgi:hypothetical protein
MKIKSLLTVTFLVVVLISYSGCNKLENATNSSVKLILWSIIGQDTEGNDSSIVLSDVITDGSIFEDTATASLTAVLLDPVGDLTDSTFYQNAIVDQVDIVYSRSDMPGAVEGVDVPYSFSQKVQFIVETGQSNPSQLGFVLIQHNAKIESPLVELINLGQEHVLKLEATITFHARDVAGYRLEPVTGTISIWCANFGDTGSGGQEGDGTGGGGDGG